MLRKKVSRRHAKSEVLLFAFRTTFYTTLLALPGYYALWRTPRAVCPAPFMTPLSAGACSG